MPNVAPKDLQEGVNDAATIGRVIALGWYDGVVNGLLRIGEDGQAYRFELIDPRQQMDDAADRVFALFPIPVEAFDSLVELLCQHIVPKWPVWVPIWTFPTEAAKSEASAATRSIAQKAGRLSWIVVGALGDGPVQATPITLSQAS